MLQLYISITTCFGREAQGSLLAFLCVAPMWGFGFGIQKCVRLLLVLRMDPWLTRLNTDQTRHHLVSAISTLH